MPGPRQLLSHLRASSLEILQELLWPPRASPAHPAFTKGHSAWGLSVGQTGGAVPTGRAGIPTSSWESVTHFRAGVGMPPSQLCAVSQAQGARTARGGRGGAQELPVLPIFCLGMMADFPSGFKAPCQTLHL